MTVGYLAKDSYLGDVQWLMGEMEDLLLRSQREYEDLQSYVSGQRVSGLPLGSRFLLNRGQDFERLVLEIEMRFKGARDE